MSNIKYSLSEEEMKDIRLFYWEVWQGLPDLEFEKAETEGGLRYNQNGNYIWVPPNALEAYHKNPDTIYLVMMNKTRDNKIKALSLEPKTDSLESVIKRAIELNRNEMEEVRKKRSQKLKVSKNQNETAGI